MALSKFVKGKFACFCPCIINTGEYEFHHNHFLILKYNIGKTEHIPEKLLQQTNLIQGYWINIWLQQPPWSYRTHSDGFKLYQ